MARLERERKKVQKQPLRSRPAGRAAVFSRQPKHEVCHEDHERSKRDGTENEQLCLWRGVFLYPCVHMRIELQMWRDMRLWCDVHVRSDVQLRSELRVRVALNRLRSQETRIMPIAIRDRRAPRPALTPVDGLDVRIETRAHVMALLQNRSEAEMSRRLADGHRAYVALRAGDAAAWGWVATRSANIGELRSTFTVPNAERYLWNFVTLAGNRGLGIYPRLLDAIVEAEQSDADRFWVAYAPENHASGAGIRKAGFTDIAALSFDEYGRPAVADIVSGGAALAATFLGIPAVDDVLAHCWRCAKHAAPMSPSCFAGPCSCDYQRVEVAC